MASPIFIVIRLIVMCVPNQKYPPFSSIPTVPLTYPNRLILHISHIYYHLCHWMSFNSWKGSWCTTYCSCRWLIKLDILYAYHMYAWDEWEGPYWLIKCTQRDYTYILFRCYDDSATAIVYRWYDARSRRRIFLYHQGVPRIRLSLVAQPRWR